MYTSILSATMQGIRAIPVQVEVDVSPGLPGFSMVGTVNSQVREAQDRVRTALHNLEIPVPPRRITINLSPADVPKAGTGFDLPITAAILDSLGQLPKGGLESVMVTGEVGLDGQIKKVRGVLAMVEEARKSGCQGCIVPWENRREAQMIQGIRSVGVRNLGEFMRTVRERTWEHPEKEREKMEIAPEITADFREIKSNFEQYTLDLFIKEGYFEKHINRMRTYYRKIRDELLDAIANSALATHCNIAEEDSGLHFLLYIDTSLSDDALSAKAKEYGLHLSFLSEYYEKGSPNIPAHTLIINYSGLTSEKIPQVITLLSKCILT